MTESGFDQTLEPFRPDLAEPIFTSQAQPSSQKSVNYLPRSTRIHAQVVGGNTGASSSESLAFRSRNQHQARSASESAGSSSVTAGVQKSSGAAKRRLGGTRTIKKIISGWWARTPPEMALVVPPPIDKKRVKVYELRNNDWFDRGTGFCTGRVVGDDSRISVESEDQPDRMLLETRIAKDDGYQKQQETLIVWTESSGTDMALSFQEAEGCAAIWEFVSRVQQHLMAIAGPDDALSDDAMDNYTHPNPNPLVLPPPELSNLDEIASILRTLIASPQGRDSLSKFVLTEDYLRKLVPLVSVAEDLESLDDLHHLCNIMKMLVLMNDTQIIEHVVSDDVVMGVVGALEYDPDFPTHKANHRRYLKDRSKYKEVVPIQDPAITKKIHATWRLLYLKDVVLARILDDPTFSVLNSLIFFNQVDIVSHLQGNTAFLEELFGIVDDPSARHSRKKDAVAFIQNCCAIAKNLQAPGRQTLYTNFIQNGLLRIINFALLNNDSAIRVAGTDILVAMIDHDASMVRAYIFRSIQDGKRPLTDTLIELLLIESDLGVKAQAADAIKVLLEPQPPSPPNVDPATRNNGEFLSKLRGNPTANPQIDSFIQNFYDNSANKLFKPLKDLEKRQSLAGLTFQEVSLFHHLIEILMFLIRYHLFRSKIFIFSEGLPARIAQLLGCPQKHLKLTALKFFRSCIALQDDYYIQQMTRNFLFEPILNILYDTMPRDNLLNSVCLELFEFVKRENVKPVIMHVVENYREKLQEIGYVDTFETLIIRYDQFQGYNPEDPTLFGPGQDGTPSRSNVNGNQRWQGVKEMDAAEEAYFNTSDDEDELANKKAAPKRPSAVKGTSPLARSLVDYPDDEEETTDAHGGRAMERKPIERMNAQAVDENATSSASRSASRAPPPERLSEKRRREEADEEDELGKLSNSKRRSSSISSSSSGMSMGSNSSNMLRRKKPFMSNSKESASSSEKIKISLSAKASAGGDAKRD
ncbi:MAG: hypothetical protein LQ344_007851 [Seirophora lacunosa]|nr:MAG: hypothetical protein LQ344_007851 [Seirophora lacunosa]